MKRIKLFGLCCAVLFAGCTTDINEVTVPTAKQIPIEVFGSISQVASSRVDDNGFCTGDGVGIYVVNYNGQNPGALVSEGNQADNVRFVFDFDEYRWIPDYDIYYRDDTTPVDIIGYYPYAPSVEKVEAYSFEVQQKQNTEAIHGQM